MNILRKYILITLCLLLLPLNVSAGDINILDSKIKFKKTKASVYYFLQHISEETGYMFIYDSNIIDNNSIINLKKKENSINSILQEIIRLKNLEIKVIDSYIILSPTNINENLTQQTITIQKDSIDYVSLHGCILNSNNNKPISYCSIGIENSSIGTVSNNEGEFKIIIPDTLLENKLVFSHIGFNKKEIKASVCVDKYLNIYITPKVLSLSEIVINSIDPYNILDSVKTHIKANYSQNTAYITGFYREGINYKDKHIDLTEGVLKIYKPGYNTQKMDQAKIFKMRRVKDSNVNDSIRAIVKIQSGIYACFALDIIKYFPDFLEFNKFEENPYIYKYTGISELGNRKVIIISFEQNKDTKRGIYIGDLYIDAENFALIEARFRINPKLIKSLTPVYVVHHHKNLKVELKNVEYIVSYKKLTNNYYYFNQIKGKLDFSIRNKKWFSSRKTPINVWFELINCQIETNNVIPFPRKERVSKNLIFSENTFTYDNRFWEQFNTIVPEKELESLIQKSINEIMAESYPE